MKSTFLLFALAGLSTSMFVVVNAGAVQKVPNVDSTKAVRVYKDKSNGLYWSSAFKDEAAKDCDSYTKQGCGFAYFDNGLPHGRWPVTGKCQLEGWPKSGPHNNSECKVVEKYSAAALACRNVGGRLPTRQDWISLLRNFDHTEITDSSDEGDFVDLGDPVLTQKGLEDMEAIFHDTTLRKTVVPGYPGDINNPGYPDEVYDRAAEFWSISAVPYETQVNYVYVFSVRGYTSLVDVSDRSLGEWNRGVTARVRCVFSNP